MARLVSISWLPAALIAAAVTLALSPGMMPMGMRGVLPLAPYAVAAGTALLAARFHQSRAVFAAAVLALAGGATGVGGLAVDAAAVLVPLNMAVVAFLSEKGVFSGAGMLRLALIAAQGVGVTWVVFGGDGAASRDLNQILQHRFLAPEVLPGMPLGQPALAASVLAAAALLARAIRTAAPLDGGLLGALVATVLAAFGLDGELLLTAAGVVLLVSVVQESYRLAYIDELTGLPGRRALMTEMGKLGGRYAVAMLDVDHFKKFNDTYGHDVGDQVLQMVATRVGRVSGGGKGFRYGGEEFTVLFPGRTAQGALEHLEALRAAVEAAGFRLRGKDRPKGKPAAKTKTSAVKTVSVTISIGAADVGDGASPADVLKAADAKLYKAKKAGRNRVVA